MATETLHESFDSQDEIFQNLRTTFADIENKFPFVKSQVDLIKPRVELLSLVFSGANSNQQKRINAILNYLIVDFNLVNDGQIELSDEECLRRINYVDETTRALELEVRNSVFNNVRDINISISTASETPTVQPSTPTTESTGQSDGGVLNTITFGAFERTDETPPATVAPPAPLIESKEASVTTGTESIEEAVSSIYAYKVYLQANKSSYASNHHIYIDAIIGFIDGLENDILPINELLEKTHVSPELYGRILNDLNTVKIIAAYDRENDDFNITLDRTSASGDKYTGTFSEILNKLTIDRTQIINISQVALSELQEEATERGIDISNLNSYQRAIYDDTKMLPGSISDVGGWDLDNILNLDDYSQTVNRFDRIHSPGASLSQITEVGREVANGKTWLFGSVPDPFEFWQRSQAIKSDDLERYLEETGSNQNDMREAMGLGFGLLEGEFFTQRDILSEGLNSITPDDLGNMPAGANLTFEWNGSIRTFDTYEEKAQYIVSQLIILDAAANDIDTLIGFTYKTAAIALSLPGRISDNISELLNIESWGGLLGLFALKAGGYLFMSALPIRLIIRRRAGRGREKSDQLIDKYNTEPSTTRGTFSSWVRTQPDLSPGEIKSSINLHKHYEVIDRLIAQVEQSSNTKSIRYISVLEKFRENDLMNLGDTGWKMALEENLAVAREGFGAGVISGVHRFGRVNLRGGYDVNIRGAINLAGGNSYEKNILKILGIDSSIINFRDLLKDTSLSSLSRTEIDGLKPNITRYINNLSGLDDTDRNARLSLLNNYILGISTDKPIPERVFLFTVREISDGRITNISGTRNIDIPSTFDSNAQDTARENFITIDEAQQKFNENKAKVRSSIEGLPTDYDNIKNKLLGKLNKIHEIEKLEKFEEKFVNPITDAINNTLEKPSFDTSIRDVIKSELLSALQLSDDTAKETRIKELTEKIPAIENLLKEAARENFDEGDLRKTIINELKLIIEYKGSDFTQGITDLSGEIKDANIILGNISSLEDELKKAFRETIVKGFEDHGDGGQSLKDSAIISKETSSTLRSIGSLNVENIVKDSMRDELKAIILDTNSIDFSTLNKGIADLIRLQSFISGDTHGTIPEDTKTQLNNALSGDTVNWAEIGTLADNTKVTLDQAAAERTARAGAATTPGTGDTDTATEATDETIADQRGTLESMTNDIADQDTTEDLRALKQRFDDFVDNSSNVISRRRGSEFHDLIQEFNEQYQARRGEIRTSGSTEEAREAEAGRTVEVERTGTQRGVDIYFDGGTLRDNAHSRALNAAHIMSGIPLNELRSQIQETDTPAQARNHINKHLSDESIDYTMLREMDPDTLLDMQRLVLSDKIVRALVRHNMRITPVNINAIESYVSTLPDPSSDSYNNVSTSIRDTFGLEINLLEDIPSWNELPSRRINPEILLELQNIRNHGRSNAGEAGWRTFFETLRRAA